MYCFRKPLGGNEEWSQESLASQIMLAKTRLRPGEIVCLMMRRKWTQDNEFSQLTITSLATSLLERRVQLLQPSECACLTHTYHSIVWLHAVLLTNENPFLSRQKGNRAKDRKQTVNRELA